jgi:uncharacterized Zn finger protein
MANSSVYDPGKADQTTIRQSSPTTFRIDSFRGAGAYIITMGEQPSCTCPHWLKRIAGTDGQCKHQVAVIDFLQSQKAERAAKYHELTLKAGSLDDETLLKLIEKYRSQPGPVLLALLGEQFDRQALEVVTEAPASVAVEPAPAGPAATVAAGMTDEQLRAVFA